MLPALKGSKRCRSSPSRRAFVRRWRPMSQCRHRKIDETSIYLEKIQC